MKSWLQRKFINILVRHLFNTVTEEDILQMRGQSYLFLGRPLDKEVVIKLKADAKMWRSSSLWQILSTEAKWKANERMFFKGSNPADLLFGKAMLYLLVEVIEQKLEQLSN
jgi:hypothetical protein